MSSFSNSLTCRRRCPTAAPGRPPARLPGLPAPTPPGAGFDAFTGRPVLVNLGTLAGAFVAFDPANSAAPGSLELGRERLQTTHTGN